MKKQFFRVKQLADQTFLRAEKSEQLSEDLQNADQKVEFFKGALTSIGKRLGPISQTQAQNPETNEKRLKKLLEYQIGMVMLEYGTKKEEISLEDSVLLKPILKKCGQAQLDLARELAEHENKVEQMVTAKVHHVLENDIPNILKYKRNLSKLVLDKDSANNRYQTASKHGTKNESLKDEMEEAELKVEQCRDSLACEMFSFLRKESEFAQIMLQLVKLQRAYHESVLHTLKNLIPELEKEIGDSPVKAVFGCPLEEHLRLNNRQIALPLELCVCALWELGMTEEGLFRVAGGASKVRRMKLSLDSGCFSCPLQHEYRDVHVIASVLKSYLRELPEPLLTYNFYNDWLHSTKLPENLRLESIKSILEKLPEPNRENLRYLIKFLAELTKNPKNKMNSSNIAIVIAPNLLWSHTEICNGIDMTSATIVNSVVETLVSNVDTFFPGEFTPYISFNRDELFRDLTEFERPNISHLRSSSNDTALISVDPDLHLNHFNERNSPPQGSPKPVIRRKNKPAPTPPNFPKTEDRINQKSQLQYISMSSTINRATYKAAKNNNQNNDNKMSVSIGTDDFTISTRRKSLDFDANLTSSNNSNKNYDKNSHRKSEHLISKNDISSPITTETTNQNLKSSTCNEMNSSRGNLVNSGVQGVNLMTGTSNLTCVTPGGCSGGTSTLTGVNPNGSNLPGPNLTETSNLTGVNMSSNMSQINVQPNQTSVGKIKITSDNLQQKSNVFLPPFNGKTKVIPVAAPRTILNNEKTKNENDFYENESDVVLRNSGSTKPVVPERPATLRPSFRNQGQRQTINDLEGILSTQLERTHVYSVPDKQQVSIVQVAQNRLSGEKFKMGHDMQMAEKEKFLGHQPAETVDKTPRLPRLSLENNKLHSNDVNSNNQVATTEISRNNTNTCNLTRTQSIGSRPERPPKPDIMKSLERIDMIDQNLPNSNKKTSQQHARTMSHGDIVEIQQIVEGEGSNLRGGNSNQPMVTTPTSPRSGGFGRIPPIRPQPPPPPPPVRPKSEGESTDL